MLAIAVVAGRIMAFTTGSLLIAVVAVAALRPTVTGGGASSLPVVDVVAHEIVSESGRDTLDPLPGNPVPTISADAAVAELQRFPGLALYVANPSQLRIERGLYSGPNLSIPAANVPAYVIRGGTSNCDASGPVVPSGQISRLKTSGTCAATIVVNAINARPLVFYRTGPL